MVLTPIIVARLPQDIRLEWSRESAGREGDVEWLMKFLQTEIQRRERLEIFKDLSMEKSNAPQDIERRKVSSASALQTTGKTICVINNSPSRQGVAHTPSEQVNNTVNTGSGTVEHVGISHDQRVKRSTVLQTAKIKTLTNDGKSVDAIVMFDLGADTTYLADDYGSDRDLTLDILIGVDNYWRFVSPENFIRCEDLVAFESLFGWILSGSCMKTQEENVFHQMLCISTAKPVNESELHEFWSLESIGICAGRDKPPKDPVLDKFEDSVKFVDGRYEVALPWKSDVSKLSLLKNETGARKRLATLNSKFERNPSLRIEYDKVLKSYEDSNIIEEVPQSEMEGPYPIYYLPHRPVIKECVSSKIRPVFDASAVGSNGVSLNDCLESGPSLIPDLVEILLRFRRWKIGLTADITKAFLQIRVQRSDQDVHRFLWQCGQSLRVMRFVRVPFGNTSSPFLLNATIRHHLNSYPVSVTVQELQENLYVDDWLSGADTVEEANTMFLEAQSILSDALESL
ncbi:uncharacterized protein LOC143023227 [Oratosquilla oratoria]|uniref:uncharacterized protein LOC143023227 n=1 Tax=Oratosquilla oratoria TaxID=337810 RepID=UPI003F7584BB